jgi:hypothetical protein
MLEDKLGEGPGITVLRATAGQINAHAAGGNSAEIAPDYLYLRERIG